MKVTATAIPDVLIIEPQVFGDHRGLFLETFHARRYREEAGIESDFVQDNFSRSNRGVLRGLHFQRKYPQGKLVRVVRGEVFDVAVDIRPSSVSYAKWVGVILSEENRKQLWIPPGLAHGFLVLSDVADLEYKCTDYYDPSDEGCLLWCDPEVGIGWPLENAPLLSRKDSEGVGLRYLMLESAPS